MQGASSLEVACLRQTTRFPKATKGKLPRRRSLMSGLCPGLAASTGAPERWGGVWGCPRRLVGAESTDSETGGSARPA